MDQQHGVLDGVVLTPAGPVFDERDHGFGAGVVDLECVVLLEDGNGFLTVAGVEGSLVAGEPGVLARWVGRVAVAADLGEFDRRRVLAEFREEPRQLDCLDLTVVADREHADPVVVDEAGELGPACCVDLGRFVDHDQRAGSRLDAAVLDAGGEAVDRVPGALYLRAEPLCGSPVNRAGENLPAGGAMSVGDGLKRRALPDAGTTDEVGPVRA